MPRTGTPSHNNLPPLDEKTKGKIIDLYTKHGITIRLMTQRFGRSHHTIRTVLVEGGVQL